MSKDIYENGMYDDLWKLAHELQPWFDIDKVKPYTVYVWTKGVVDGENVFDICADKLQFYTCTRPWELPNEAMSVIKKIQEKLKEIDDFQGGPLNMKED